MTAMAGSSQTRYNLTGNFTTATGMPRRSRTTKAGTFYDRNAVIRPLFYELNLGIAYGINGDGNIYEKSANGEGGGGDSAEGAVLFGPGGLEVAVEVAA